MRRAVHGLALRPDQVIIDGRSIPQGLGVDAIAAVKADQQYASVSAASILAKTSRDEWCMALDKEYPDYGFAQHKGRSEEHTSELQSRGHLVCRLLLEK